MLTSLTPHRSLAHPADVQWAAVMGRTCGDKRTDMPQHWRRLAPNERLAYLTNYVSFYWQAA